MDSRYLTDCAAENRSLAKLLEPVLKGSFATGTRPAELQILSLACGPCREIEAVTSSLRRAVPGGTRDVRIIGADIRGAQIDEARERGRRLSTSGVHAEFLVADCSNLARHREMGTGFEIVFLRHQNFWHQPAVWRRIFDGGLERLHENGLLVITSYFDKEHDLATRAIVESGAQLVTSVRNPASRQLHTPGKSVDRHVAVFRRPGRSPV